MCFPKSSFDALFCPIASTSGSPLVVIGEVGVALKHII